MADAQFLTDRGQAVIPAGSVKVLRNTYMLLSLTLLFSAAMAGVSMALNVPPMGILIYFAGVFGLLYGIHKLKNSAWGILMVFAFTGFIGFYIGPIISIYMANGPETVMTTLGLTGIVFFSLSGYTLVSGKDFSYMSGFLMTGIVVAIGSIILMWVASMFGYDVSALQLAISAAIVFLMSGFILYDTSKILHGGETNYLMATVALYLDIYLLFMYLLHLVNAFSGDD
jgi:modulator of FtsH protease